MANRIMLNETSYHGSGAIQEIATEAKAHGFKKALVCSDPDLIKFGVTAKVTDMVEMFHGCENLKTIYAGDGWNTSKVENSEGMFEDCHNLVGGKGTTFSSEVRDKTRAKVDGGKENPGYKKKKK